MIGYSSPVNLMIYTSDHQVILYNTVVYGV
jgi:hypothetical protein